MKNTTLAVLAFFFVQAAQAQSFSNRYDIQGYADVTVERYCGLPSGGGLMASIRQDAALVVTRIQPDGAIAWSQAYAPPASYSWYEAYDMGMLADGGYYVLGSLSDFGNTFWVLLRLDASANVVWGRRLLLDQDAIGGEYDRTSKVVQRADGSLVVLIAGAQRFALVGVGLDADLLFSKSYTAVGDPDYNKNPGFDLVNMEDGGVIVCAKDRDWPYLLRADNMGSTMWAKTYPSIPSSYTHWRNMVRLSSGDLLIAGFSAEHGGTIWRLTIDGTILWMKGLTGTAYLRQLADLGNGEFIAADDMAGFVRFNENGDVLGSFQLPSQANAWKSFVGGNGVQFEIAATYVPYSGTQLIPFVVRHTQDELQNCSAVGTQVIAMDIAGAAGYAGTPAVIEYDEPCSLLDAPFTASMQEWSVGDACGMLVGMEHLEDAAVTISPTLVENGGTVQITGIEGEIDHELISSDGSWVRRGHGTTVATAGIAPGLYALRVLQRTHPVLVQRVVIR